MLFLRKQQSWLLVSATVSLPGKREPSGTFWMPALAARTKKLTSPGLAFGQPGLSQQGRGKLLPFGQNVTKRQTKRLPWPTLGVGNPPRFPVQVLS